MNSFVYLKKLKINLNSIRNLISLLEEDEWKRWTNPTGKVVRAYTQVYHKDIKLEKTCIKDILNQLPKTLEYGLPVILRYKPHGWIKPHKDWENKSAVLIGISENSQIFFWNGDDQTVVPYTYPILANLESIHSVTNDTEEYRYVLKIPFKNGFNDTYPHLTNLL